MPAEVLNDPLGISCVFSNGSRLTATLGDTANPRLARDLLAGLAELVHPHGTVDAAGSVRHYLSALGGMVTALAGRGFTGSAADLHRAQVAEFWMGTTGAHEACTRRMLLGFAAAGGMLDARVGNWPRAAPITCSPSGARCRLIRRSCGPGLPRRARLR